MSNASRDENSVPTLLGVSSSDGVTPVPVYVDPSTHRVLASGIGTTGPIGPTGPTGPTSGASGSFTTTDGKTVTVVNGLITTIV